MIYRISNPISGVDLGLYEADDRQGALDAMARLAGYRDHAEACAVTGNDPGELAVELVIVVPDPAGHA